MSLKHILYIDDSTIKEAGKGAFALRNIKKNECIGEYKGKFLTLEQKLKKKSHTKYIWELLDDDDNVIGFIDGGNKRYSNELRYVNSPCKEKLANTFPLQKGNKMYYYASRNIKKGDELFIWYGDEYAKYLGLI